MSRFIMDHSCFATYEIDQRNKYSSQWSLSSFMRCVSIRALRPGYFTGTLSIGWPSTGGQKNEPAVSWIIRYHVCKTLWGKRVSKTSTGFCGFILLHYPPHAPMAARRGGHLYLDQTTPPRDCCPLQKVPLPKLDDLKWIAENIDNIDRYSIYIYMRSGQ